MPVQDELVIGFLRSLRDNRVAAWRRLQAARALEAYQRIMHGTEEVDFQPIKLKLGEIARREKFAADGAEGNSLVAGEGNRGLIDSDEPDVIRQLRSRCVCCITRRRLRTPTSGGSNA